MDNTQTHIDESQNNKGVQNSNTFKYIIILISIFVILVITVPVVAYFFFFSNVKNVVVNDNTNQVQKDDEVKEEEEEIEEVKIPRANLFAWVEDNTDKTKSTVKVYYEDKVIDLYTKNITVGDYISLISVSEEGVLLEAYDSKSNLYKYTYISLDTHKAVEVSSSKEYFYMFTQYDDKYYFYLKENEKNSSLYLYSANSKKSTYLFDIDVLLGGRGPAPYDTIKTTLTKDKSKMLFINSTQIGNPVARTTFVYNIDKKDNNFQINLIGKVLNSAGSIWVDNENLVYLKMTNEKPNGVYTYNTGTKQSTILKNVLNDGFYFSMNRDLNKMLYTKATFSYEATDAINGDDVYIFDFTKEENTKTMKAASVQWVGEYLVAVVNYRKCQNEEECAMSDYEFDNTEIIDIRDNSTLMVIDNYIMSYQD